MYLYEIPSGFEYRLESFGFCTDVSLTTLTSQQKSHFYLLPLADRPPQSPNEQSWRWSRRSAILQSHENLAGTQTTASGVPLGGHEGKDKKYIGQKKVIFRSGIVQSIVKDMHARIRPTTFPKKCLKFCLDQKHMFDCTSIYRLLLCRSSSMHSFKPSRPSSTYCSSVSSSGWFSASWVYSFLVACSGSALTKTERGWWANSGTKPTASTTWKLMRTSPGRTQTSTLTASSWDTWHCCK